MRFDTSDRALLSLVGVFIVVYQAVLALAGNVFLELGGERLLPGNHTTADLIVAGVMVLGVAAGGVALAWPHWRAACRVAGWADGRAVPLHSGNVDRLRRAAPPDLVDRIVLVDDAGPTAFTVGLWRPRVVVSRGLLRASAPELTAILAHEAYHVRRHDPARRLVAGVVCAALLHLPVAVRLRDRVMAASEFEADRQALQRSGRRPVAAALYRLLSADRSPAPSLAASMAGPDLLAARVAQLETGATPVVRIAALPWLVALAGVTAAVMAMDLVVGGLDPGHHWTLPAPAHGLVHVLPLWVLWPLDHVMHRAR